MEASGATDSAPVPAGAGPLGGPRSHPCGLRSPEELFRRLTFASCVGIDPEAADAVTARLHHLNLGGAVVVVSPGTAGEGPASASAAGCVSSPVRSAGPAEGSPPGGLRGVTKLRAQRARLGTPGGGGPPLLLLPPPRHGERRAGGPGRTWRADKTRAWLESYRQHVHAVAAAGRLGGEAPGEGPGEGRGEAGGEAGGEGGGGEQVSSPQLTLSPLLARGLHASFEDDLHRRILLTLRPCLEVVLWRPPPPCGLAPTLPLSVSSLLSSPRSPSSNGVALGGDAAILMGAMEDMEQ